MPDIAAGILSLSGSELEGKEGSCGAKRHEDEERSEQRDDDCLVVVAEDPLGTASFEDQGKGERVACSEEVDI